MKSFKYALLSAAACGMASAAETAYTTPVGYTTQTLPANTISLVGLNVLTPTLVTSQLTGVSGNDIADSNVNFGTALPAGKMCVLEITSGTAAGLVQEFTTWSGSTITLPAASGAAIGDKYRVRVAPTLQELFPSGSLTTAGINPTSADKVWVPVGNGTYTKYWVKTGTNAGWHTTVTGTSDTGLVSGDIPVVYIDGLLVEKKATAGSIVISGEVKREPTNVLIQNGINVVTIAPPVGLTLFTSGLDGTDLTTAGINPTSADKVWVPVGDGTFTKYWIKTGTNAGWHTTVTGTSDTGLVTVDVPLSGAIYIERKAVGSKVISFAVPVGYSSL